MQDRTGFADLDHEGGLAPRQIVTGADPGEQPIDHPDRGLFGGDERAELGQDDAQADLPENG